VEEVNKTRSGIEEEEFTDAKFRIALYTNAKESNFTKMQGLEATEYTIHRNIHKVRKQSSGERFQIGDKVLVKKTKFNTAKIKGTLLVPLVIRAMVEYTRLIWEKEKIHTKKISLLAKWFCMKPRSIQRKVHSFALLIDQADTRFHVKFPRS